MAVIMKTRKSRFFWILLCLLGEPQFSGIVAVAPRSLRLPSLDTVAPGTILWLQSSHQDDVCLGMSGNLLYECGDTTLWVMEPLNNNNNNDGRQRDNNNNRLFELRVVDHTDSADDDNDIDQVGESNGDRTAEKQRKRAKTTPSRKERRIRRREAECLTRGAVVDGDDEEEESHEHSDGSASMLRVGACHNQQHRWWWKLWKKNRQMAARSVWSMSPDGKLSTPNGEYCIAGVGNDGGKSATLTSCRDESAIIWTFLKAQPQHQPFDEEDIKSKQKKTKRPTSQLRAVEPAMHPELKVQSNLLFQRSSRRRATAAAASLQQPPQRTLTTRQSEESSSSSSLPPNVLPRKRTSLPLHVALTNATPGLMAHHLSSGHDSNKNSKKRKGGQQQPAHRLHAPNMGGVTKVQRIQTHPYLNAAQNEIWTDPATGLEFRTDLRQYLNHAEAKGRHTLTGVGIYRKYGIKVYGVAFYVTKHDVLAESLLAPFAGLTADELRKRPDFYELLRSDNANLDRTILIKTNMQLSAETMRNSLQADWSYLTPDAKKLLAETGMQKLPADETMLQTILPSPDNPSRCSCMQTTAHLAEPVTANEECCARGTELAFTWTKDDALEVRLNGRFMASFDRPDIGQGIFYEYLRYDDPISPELLLNVVDGFPFLLAPLNMGIRLPTSSSSFQTKEASPDWLNHARTQAAEWANNVRKTIVESAFGAARGIGEAAAHQAEQFEKGVWPHLAAAPGTVVKIVQRDEETWQAIGRWMSGADKAVTIEDIAPLLLENVETSLSSSSPSFSTRSPIRPHHHHHYLRYYYAGDEIGPLKFHPTINRLALILVHFYLLLLFIVSFPGSSYRIIIVRHKTASSSSSSSRDDRCTASRPAKPAMADRYERPRQRLYLWQDQTRKSLSYNFV